MEMKWLELPLILCSTSYHSPYFSCHHCLGWSSHCLKASFATRSTGSLKITIQENTIRTNIQSLNVKNIKFKTFSMERRHTFVPHFIFFFFFLNGFKHSKPVLAYTSQPANKRNTKTHGSFSFPHWITLQLIIIIIRAAHNYRFIQMSVRVFFSE